MSALGLGAVIASAKGLGECFGSGLEGSRRGAAAGTAGRTQHSRKGGASAASAERIVSGASVSRSVVQGRGLASRRDGLDRLHRAAAASWADAQRAAREGLEAVAVVGRRLAVRGGRGHPQQPLAEGELLLAAGPGKESEVADAVEARRQRVVFHNISVKQREDLSH